MRKTYFAGLALLLLAAWSIRTQGDEQPELKNVMKAKLGHAQAVLEGLAVEDFGKIERSAKALSALTAANAWNIHRTPEYIKFSKDFQAVADSMAANAKAKKLEAATLDYVQMTMICVKCHSYTRNAGLALQGGDPGLRDDMAVNLRAAVRHRE